MPAPPSTTISTPIDPRISAIASGIAAAIPQAQVRLFGSRTRGTSRPDSDVDLLITVPDQWLAGHDRVRVQSVNASNTEVPLHPWLIKKEFC